MQHRSSSLLRLRQVSLLIGCVSSLSVLEAAVDPGELLVSEMNCVACHTAEPGVAERLSSRPSPILGSKGRRLKTAWIEKFLRDPQTTKPGTLMPDLLHGLADPEKEAAADALAAYLRSPQPGIERIASDVEVSNERGRKIYHTIGCEACHAPSDPPPGEPAPAEELERLRAASVPIAELGNKMAVSELASYLRDPLATFPGGRMPDFQLSANEAREIASYLTENGRDAVRDSELQTLDPEKVERGRQLYRQLNCSACHLIDQEPSAAKPLARLNVRQPGGCLATSPKPTVPKWSLTDRQRVVLLASLQGQSEWTLPLTPEQTVRRTMTTLNCYSCHSRERRGGANGLRRLYLFPDANTSPTWSALNGIGAKYPTADLFKLLGIGRATTGDSSVRMPGYGATNARTLSTVLSAADHRDSAPPQ